MGTHGPIKYHADFTFFDLIDSDTKAYWLGFIAADGTITGGHQMSVSLGMKDSDHLFRLKEAMGAEHPVKFYSYPKKKHFFARFHISCKPMGAALARLGITPNKTLTLCMPPIDRALIHAFVRGYFDGDGCIYIGHITANYLRPLVNILGTQMILSAMQSEMLLHDIKCRVRPENRGHRVSVLQIDAANSVMRFREWIYRDASVYLPRKKEKLDSVCAPRKCVRCGNTFQPERDRGRFCSRNCYQRHYRKENLDHLQILR